MRYLLIAFIFIGCNTGKKEPVVDQEHYLEKHRPQIHFSPKANWMNDPNGMVYHNGIYHLFFQYYPDSTVWGPMHWGHATSKDLVHWNEEDIALYPDSLGYIFSGSAVVDQNNTSGLGKDGKIPLVAIYTYHDTVGEKAGRNDYQTQGIAYSLDDGKTWAKYEKNPVLKNPGIIDFRDPKVMWYEPGKTWIMTLAVKDRISFYSSPDLKNWTKESEFGEKLGAHGGVWECPDLFKMNHNGDSVWVLFVSINPGGPNKGSATQYFIGQFDGKHFTTNQTDIRWLDWGPDNYAGVTWSNVGDRKLFLGWMSNWLYAQSVPTHPWRSAMTVPRDIGIKKIGDKYLLTSTPAKELDLLNGDKIPLKLDGKPAKFSGPARLKFRAENRVYFRVALSNAAEEKLIIAYYPDSNRYLIVRTGSGNVNFEEGFAELYRAPRMVQSDSLDFELIIDNSSVEIFADGGLTVMTAIFFPNEVFSHIEFASSADKLKVTSLECRKMKGIWK